MTRVRTAPIHGTPRDVPPSDLEIADWLHMRRLARECETSLGVRISAENQLRSVGKIPDEIKTLCQPLREVERLKERELVTQYRRLAPSHVLEWQRSTRGVSERNLARLLAYTGPPRWAIVLEHTGTGVDRTAVVKEVRPRRVSDLWSYCGVGDPRRNRRDLGREAARQGRSMTQDELFSCGAMSPGVVLHRMFEKVATLGSGTLYDVWHDAKIKYEERDWPQWRKQAAAVRVVKKEFLKLLWREFDLDRGRYDTQATNVEVDNVELLGIDRPSHDALRCNVNAEAMKEDSR